MAGIATLLGCLMLLSGEPHWVIVSASRGDDTAGDGSRDRPLRSITTGLDRLARDASGGGVWVEEGRYGVATGERFPLELVAGGRLCGSGSAACLLEVPSGATALHVLRGEGECSVSGLCVHGGDVGIAVRASGALSVTLVDVACLGARTGVELRTEIGDGEGHGTIRCAAKALRVRDCDVGLLVSGAGRHELCLEESVFENNRIGLLLAPAEKSAAAGDRLVVARCEFRAHREAGVRRVGPWVAAATAAAHQFDDCVFIRNHTGLALEHPAGDTPIAVRRSRFWENEYYGLIAVGREVEAGEPSLVEDCDFRWNGTGLYVANVTRGFAVRGSRFESNLGPGIFLANFVAPACAAGLSDCFLLHNGGSGIYVVADGTRLEATIEHCTMVANGGGAVARRNRHGGTSGLSTRACILWRNTFGGRPRDLVEISPDEIADCLISDTGEWGRSEKELEDPGFIDPARRDYRLRADSPWLHRYGPREKAKSGEAAHGMR
ncbi:MAG: right-handed parallel beta-helix repeat-containing protein [Planctomycetota bacterium]